MIKDLGNKIGQLQYEISCLGLDKEELTGVNVRTEELKALVKNNVVLQNVSSCYAVFDEEDNIVQLYQTEEKANKGLWEFQNSHPHIEFHVDTMQIN